MSYTMDGCEKLDPPDSTKLVEHSTCFHREMYSSASPTPYVQGLDGTFATYFTDYIFGILCLVLAVKIYISLHQCRKLFPDQRDTDKETLCDVGQSPRLKDFVRTHFEDAKAVAHTLCIAYVLCSIMHLLGGLVHHSIRYVIPDSIKYNYTEDVSQAEYEILRNNILPLYLIWQVAKMSASAFAMCLAYLAFRTFICDSLHFTVILSPFHRTDFIESFPQLLKLDKFYLLSTNLRKRRHVVVGVLLFILLTQVVYHGVNGVIFSSGENVTNTEDKYDISASGEGSALFPESSTAANLLSRYEELENLWTIWAMTIVLTLSLFCYAVTSTALVVVYFMMSLRKRELSCSSQQSRDALLTKTPESQSTLPPSMEAEETSSNYVSAESVSGCQTAQIRTLPVLVVRCIALWTIFGGGMIQFSLSAECGMNSAVNCPLPETFNHNALYHSFLIIGSTLWYIAEDAHLRLEIQFTQQLQQIIQNS